MSKDTQIEKNSSLKRKSIEHLNGEADRSPKSSTDINNDQNKKIKIPIKLSIQQKPLNIQTKSNEVKKDDNYARNKSQSGTKLTAIVKDNKIAKAFGSESEGEETEEIPFEMKIRMRNIGRDTPTSTGPNSYGKVGTLGFVDPRKILEKQMQEKAEEMLRIEEETAKK